MAGDISMRIAIVADTFPLYSEKFIFDSVVGLIKNGFDVDIYAARKGDFSFYAEDIKKYGIEEKIRIYPSFNPLRVFLSPAKTMLCILEAYKKYGLSRKIAGRAAYLLPFLGRKYDIIHFEFGMIGQKMIFLKDAFPETKFITSFRGSDLHCRKHYNYKELFEKCDKFHFISEYLLKEAVYSGIDKKKATIINPAIDTRMFEPAKNKKNKKINLISVGRLHWKKGYSCALSAIKILKEKGYSFTYKILGDGDLNESLQCRISDESLDGFVKLLGAIPREKVKEELEKADIFLHTAVLEGFSNAVLEAQAMELPVVCSDAGGLPENVEDGKTGFLVVSRKPEKFAEKLAKLIDNPDLRRKIGKNGRKRVIENFNLEKQSREFKDMYIQTAGAEKLQKNRSIPQFP